MRLQEMMCSYERELRSHVHDLPDGSRRIFNTWCAYGPCKTQVMLQVDGKDSMQVCFLHAPAGMLLLMREHPDSVVTPDLGYWPEVMT